MFLFLLLKFEKSGFLGYNLHMVNFLLLKYIVWWLLTTICLHVFITIFIHHHNQESVSIAPKFPHASLLSVSSLCHWPASCLFQMFDKRNYPENTLWVVWICHSLSIFPFMDIWNPSSFWQLWQKPPRQIFLWIYVFISLE